MNASYLDDIEDLKKHVEDLRSHALSCMEVQTQMTTAIDTLQADVKALQKFVPALVKRLVALEDQGQPWWKRLFTAGKE